MTHREAVLELRAVADVLQRRQKLQTQVQRRVLAAQIVAACDALDQPETPCDALPDVTEPGWGKE